MWQPALHNNMWGNSLSTSFIFPLNMSPALVATNENCAYLYLPNLKDDSYEVLSSNFSLC